MANQVDTLNGLFKDRYSESVQDLVPDHVKLFNAVKFDESKKIGKKYNEPVLLSLESGFTYAGESGSLFALNAVKEFKMENAEIAARELVLRSAISIGALSRSGNDAQSIERAMDLMVGNMLKSVYHRLEVQMFYGQSSIAEVKTDSASVTANDDIAILESSWAAGIWNGTTGAEIEIFAPDMTVKRGNYVVSGYSLKAKTVSITKESGNLTAAEIKDGDLVFFNGAAVANGSGGVKNEFLGIHGIASEVTSLFGVSNASEPLFQGSTVDVGTSGAGAKLSFAKIEDGIASMVEKGLMEGSVDCYVNPKSWNTLLTEQTAKRSVDSSYSPAKAEEGSKDIVFYGQNGDVKIIASTFVKEGFAYLCVAKDLKRIGSQEVTFKRPDGEKYLELMENNHGIEMRCYTDQALFTARPCSICILQFIDHTA